MRLTFHRSFQRKIMTLEELKETNDNNKQDVSKETFENQLDKFLEEILLTGDDIKRLYEPIINEIDNIFRPIFPKCITRCFGSTVSGLALKNSDLDVYFFPGIPVKYKKSVPGPHMIDFELLFHTVKTTLYKHPYLFTKVVPLPNTRVPIIKFIYKPTNISCDISFKTCLGVYNSQLVKIYIFSDVKFLPTMIIIKHWFNQYNLRYRMSKYTLTMLFIFYLQQLKLVPNVNKLKESIDVPFIIKGWQVYRNKEGQQFQAKPSNLSIPELLYGFFAYYSMYDFKNYTIFIADGKSHEKHILNYENNAIMSENHINDQSVQMCIQDPIELNKNLAKNMYDSHVEKFQAYCSATAKFLDDSKRNNYKDLLHKIFELEQEQKKIYKECKEHNEQKKISKPTIFYFNIPTGILSNKNFKDLNNINKWFNEIFYFTKRYLEEVLLLEVEIISDNKELNKYDLDLVDNNSTEIKQNITTLHCKGTRKMWIDREKDCSNFINPLEKDIIISKVMLKKSNEKDENSVIDFFCQFIKVPEESLKVIFKIYNYGCKEKEFNSLGGFLNTKMTSVLKKSFNLKHFIEISNKKKSSN